ncbi:phenylalanine--tRNA ligase subunit beta [Syntrophobacter fumaroxidans]|uniref:Phenylalanine--tRNA ligase beta subunit n=1 Tax=Syntrophobacter fumaroxidans (strain DSM 10017 / MPOB) TaxID=335543 RepID=A0LFC7_SYNFM|nr:phenylalanine--tRNA ligase subunit beta [Syntrophobacter fumaroxidans]ABK16129.1 phenylalanyl-tRNA synthetase beta subunit [Syntrophobacter fumaroxidans MPOB]
MIVSLKWLRDYVETSLSVEELTHRLTMVGLEIDGCHPLHPCLGRVVTARVEKVEPHPRADRLSVCEVSDGHGRYSVVCGAPNVKAGQIVPLALPGAELASGVKIGQATIRGVASLGMLCSQKELGLGEDASGIWPLPGEVPVGVPLSEALDLDDTILDVAVTPNRGDCLSIVGIAREIAAISGVRLRYPAVACRETGPEVDSLASVRIDAPDGCPRYAARVIEGITVGPSPQWLKDRLEAVGLRSINNIVDVTNYILMELGQPLHAFDFDLLREQRIVVRYAREGERFTTLDGTERILFGDTLMICDGVGPVAVAGIMGGLDSEIGARTRRVLIESACFEPRCIRRSSRKLGLRTESSYRFERGVDPEGVIRALDRAAQLMVEVGGGDLATGRVDAYPRPAEKPVLVLRTDRVNRFLGTDLTPAEMAGALRSIEMQVEENGGGLEVIPPTFRPDITREVDLAEEIARLAGYDRVPVTYPEVRMEAASLDRHLQARMDIKGYLEGAGFFEAINYSFVSMESLRKLKFPAGDRRLNPVQIRNPLSEEQAVMRTTLVPSLLQTARYNFDHKNDDLKLFELSKVFLPVEGAPLPEEVHEVAGILAGKRSLNLLYGGDDDVDYADAKGIVEGILELLHIEGVRFDSEAPPPYLDAACAATIMHGELNLGAVGRVAADVRAAFDLKKPVFVFDLDFERLFGIARPPAFFSSLPKFPSVSRDMALVVDESVPVQGPFDFIRSQGEALLEHIDIFDIYRDPQLGAGRKSIGYRLVYRAADRSLTDEEVNRLHEGLVSKVLVEFDARLR